MFDTATKEVTEITLAHESDAVREFYGALPRPVLVGLEATGASVHSSPRTRIR